MRTILLPWAALFVLGATFLASPASAAGSSSRKATHVAVERAGEAETRIVVRFTEAPTFSARLERKNRLIVDVPNTTLEKAEPALTDRVGVVGGVMAQSFAVPGGHTTRFLVTLVEEAAYAVTVDGTDLVIRLAPKRAGLAKEAAKAAAAPSSSDPARVMDVRFERGGDEDRVVIELS